MERFWIVVSMISRYISRETEQQILTSTDSIIAHLVDHMVKTHNMRGSPYFKAFEGKHMCCIKVMIVRKLRLYNMNFGTVYHEITFFQLRYVIGKLS